MRAFLIDRFCATRTARASFCHTFPAAAEQSAVLRCRPHPDTNMEEDDGAVDEVKERDAAPSLHACELADGGRSDFPLQAADSQWQG